MLGGAASFFRLPAASMAHENAPHHLRGDAEELRAILPAHFILIDEPEINLVHQGGGLQSVIRAFPAEETDRLPVEFLVDQRKQRLERARITASPGNQPPGYLSSVWQRSVLRRSRIL